MNNDRNDDQFRFNKLYQLLGDEVNQIYNDNSNSVFLNDENTNNQEIKDELFNDNENIFEENTQSDMDTSKVETPVNDIFNIFNNAPNDSEYYQKLNTNNSDVSSVNNNIESNVVNTDNLLDDKTNDLIYSEPVNIEINNNALEDIAPQSINTDNKDNADIDNSVTKTNKNEFRNITLIDKREFNDGLDGIDDGKKSLIDIITSKNAVLILAIIAFIVVSVLTIKTFNFGKVVDIYNEYTTERDRPGVTDTNIYGGDEIDAETLRKVAASELIDCIKSPINTDELPDSVKSVIDEINTYYKRNNAYYAFAYKDIFTGFTVTYNENGNIFAASTIKAPVNIYLYEKASEGEIDLDKELTYTGNYYTDGTGVLKNEKFNSKYTIRKLSEYAIRKSDNIAHNMLMDEIGRKNIKNFWQGKGTSIILTGNDNWGLINAHDAMIYMKELYTFYVNNEEYGTELMENFLNASTKFITSKNNYKVANKSGWSGFAQHDVSIIFAENPYIVVALSNLGYDNSYMSYFNKASELANNLHQEYWKYKMNMCSNIKQYSD